MLGITFSPQNYHHHQQFLSRFRENNENDMTSTVWASTVFDPRLWPLSAHRHSLAVLNNCVCLQQCKIEKIEVLGFRGLIHTRFSAMERLHIYKIVHNDVNLQKNERKLEFEFRSFLFRWNNGLRTPREEIAFTARPKIQSQSQIFWYGQSVFCLPHRPKFSDFFDLCLHTQSVVRGWNFSPLVNIRIGAYFCRNSILFNSMH